MALPRLLVLRPGACGAVRPFRGYPSHASDTPTIRDCRGPRSVGAGPFRSHGRGRPCRPQAPDCSRSRGEGLPDSSPHSSAGSGRSQNDSCGQFARVACHEMKKAPYIFISWRVFPAISLKYSHEMKKSLHSFISWPGRRDNAGRTVRFFSALLPLCPFAPLPQTSITYVRSFVFP